MRSSLKCAPSPSRPQRDANQAYRVCGDTVAPALWTTGIKRVYTRFMGAICYCALMRAATRRLGAVYDAALAPLGINIAQFSLLRRIRHHQPVSLTELGRIAGLDRSTVGRNVRVLEREKLVTTRSGDEDQREAMVVLADRGAAILEAAEPLWQKCQHEIEDRLGPARIEGLHDIMRAL